MLCENYGIVVLMYIASKFIDILQIIVPILAIIGLGINLVKAVTDPEDKKVLSRIKNCVIALIMVFAIPVLVNTTMNLLTDGYSIEGCFEIARNHENILDPSTYTDMILKDLEVFLLIQMIMMKVLILIMKRVGVVEKRCLLLILM